MINYGRNTVKLLTKRILVTFYEKSVFLHSLRKARLQHGSLPFPLRKEMKRKHCPLLIKTHQQPGMGIVMCTFKKKVFREAAKASKARNRPEHLEK